MRGRVAPGARGCVARHGNSDDSVTYSVAVSWQSPTAAGAPAYPKGASTATRNAIDCGRNQQRPDASGVATHLWTAPWIQTIFGTDAYTDQLW